MNVEKLIEGCKKKNTQAQAELYQLLSAKLFGICLKYSRSYAEAQDNLQDGFLLLFDKIKQFSGNGSFEGWAKKVMLNHVLLQYRKIPFLELVHDVPDEEQDFEIEDDGITVEFLTQIIQELPERYRLVFNLFVTDGFAHKDIAEMLQINVGTSKSNLARAKFILKEKIENHQNKKLKNAK